MMSVSGTARLPATEYSGTRGIVQPSRLTTEAMRVTVGLRPGPQRMTTWEGRNLAFTRSLIA